MMLNDDIEEAVQTAFDTLILNRVTHATITIRENANTCHNPAGNENGGQFCSGDSNESNGAEKVSKEKKVTKSQRDKNYAKIIDTPEFKNWFGNSKVVNEKGKPQIAYHGSTRSGWNEFQTSPDRKLQKNETSTLGAWFTNNPSTANSFTKNEFGKHENAGIYPVYLSMQNPKIYEPKPDSQVIDYKTGKPVFYKTSKPYFDDDGNMRLQYVDTTKPVMQTNDPFEQMMDDRDEFVDYYDVKKARGYWRKRMSSMNVIEANQAFVNKLKSEGYDGIIVKNTEYDSPRKSTTVDQYVVFDPSQIKSVFNSKPTGSKIITNSSVEYVEPDDGDYVADVKMNSEQIAGDLCRGDDGQFESCGNPTADTIDVSKYPSDAKKISKESAMRTAHSKDVYGQMKNDLADIRKSRGVKIDKVSGPVSSGFKTIRGNALRVVKSYEGYLSGSTSGRLRDYVDDVTEQLRSDTFKDADSEHIDAIIRDSVEKLVFQEVESNRQQFTDHGIRHIVGNIERQNQIAMAMNGGKPQDPRQRFMATIAMVNHDVGYTTPLIRAGGMRGVMLSGHHESMSQQIFEEQKSQWNGGKVFSSDEFDKIAAVIGKHSSTIIDRNDVLQTSISLADNLSLFEKDKLPGMFEYIEGSSYILMQMGEAAAAEDNDIFEMKRKELWYKIDNSDTLSDNLKRDLKSATREIGLLTPKFTMGTLAGEIEDIGCGPDCDSTDPKVYIDVKYNEFDKEMQTIFSMGQKQTKKLLNDYGITDFTKEEYNIGDVVVLRIKDRWMPPMKQDRKGKCKNNAGKGLMKSVGMGRDKRMPVKSIKYNPSLSAVATHVSNDNIQVGPEYFDLDRSERKYVITHELCHGLADIANERLSGEYGYAENFDHDVNELTTEVLKDDNGDEVRIFAFQMTRLEEAKTEVLTERAMNPSNLRDVYGDHVYNWAEDIYKAANVDPDQILEQANEFVDELDAENPNNVQRLNSQQIEGDLCRSDTGQFESCGNPDDIKSGKKTYVFDRDGSNDDFALVKLAKQVLGDKEGEAYSTGFRGKRSAFVMANLYEKVAEKLRADGYNEISIEDSSAKKIKPLKLPIHEKKSTDAGSSTTKAPQPEKKPAKEKVDKPISHEPLKPIPMKFIPAKNREDAENFAVNHLLDGSIVDHATEWNAGENHEQIVLVKYRGVELPIANEINKAILDNMQLGMKPLRSIVAKALRSKEKGMSMGSGIMKINTNAFGTRAKFEHWKEVEQLAMGENGKKLLKKLEANLSRMDAKQIAIYNRAKNIIENYDKYSAGDGGPASVVNHEMMHHFIDTNLGWGTDENRKMREELFIAAKKSLGSEYKYKISYYGAEGANPIDQTEEHICESYSAYRNGDPIHPDMKAAFKKYLKV